MATDVTVRPDLVIPAAELDLSASRSGGPGGQHVQKASTRVTVRWSIRDSAVLSPGQRRRLLEKLASRLTNDGDLILSEGGSRSQAMNRDAVMERLADVVRGALVRERPRRPTRPTRASKERRITSKKRRGDVKKGRGRIPDE